MKKLRNYPVTLLATGVTLTWIVLVLTMPYPTVSAQVGAAQPVDAFGYEALAPTSGAAIGFTAATIVPTNAPSAKAAVCTTETASIRYRYDGTDPTTAEGHLVAAPGTFTLYGINNIRRLKMIAASTTAAVKCTYLR